VIVTVRLLESDGTTVVTGALDQAFDVAWNSALSDPGWGQFSLPLSSAGAVEVRVGRFVQCLLDGVVVFHWQILKPPVLTTVSPEEEYGEILTAKGPGWIGGLSTAVIRPYGGISNPLVPQVRQWNFATPNFPNAGSWVAATEINGAADVNPDRYQLLTIIVTVEGEPDVTTTVVAPAPLGWYVPEAFWIWGDPVTETVGRNYFRNTFTLGAQTLITIAATGDNFYTVYLEGTPIVGENDNEACWQEHKEFTFTLPAGTYGIAAVVENLEWPVAYVNPAGFLSAVFVPDAQGGVASVVLVSDDSWDSLDYPADEPGWTAGQVLIDVRTEAQANDTLPHWLIDFTGSVDSEAATWTENINGWNQIPNISIPVGSTAFDVLTRLENEAWLEYRSAKSTMTLQCYNQLTGGDVMAWEFVDGVNIAELQFGDAESYFNRLMVKWGTGYQLVEDTAAVTANDGIAIEGTVTVDASGWRDANRLGLIALGESADPQPSISLKFLAPEAWRETELAANFRGRPYEDFREGDTINVPDVNGDLQAVRLLSLSVTQDQLDGHAEITGELNRRVRITERDREELLFSLGMGVQGQSRVSIPVSTATAVATRLDVP
jgi:hypothetical protein